MQQKQQDLKWVPFYYFLARDISRFSKSQGSNHSHTFSQPSHLSFDLWLKSG